MLVYLRLLFFLAIIGKIQTERTQKLMLVLLDGFRWNYFASIELPGFKKLFKNGVKAEYMTVDFPSLSLPNYYSVLTGLHSESHGFIGNNVYDPNTGKYWVLGNSSTWNEPLFWQDGEPIWIAVERQGKRSQAYYWIGCEVEIRGRKPSFCDPYYYESQTDIKPAKYPDIVQLRSASSRTIQSFKDGSADFSAIYFESTDAVGHLNGKPDTAAMRSKLLELDHVVDEILKNITAEGLKDEVSVIFVSDHGMTEIAPSRSINLTDAIDIRDLKAKIFDYGPVVKIWPEEDKVDKVYNDLVVARNSIGHFQVYRKNDIPSNWYYRRHDRIAPLLVVADLGWMIQQPYKPSFPSVYKGFHGYDPSNPNMRGIFIASGPALKENTVISPVHITDIYQLMCHILQINPEPNNGTWSSISGVLRETSAGSKMTNSIELLIGLFVFVLLECESNI